MILGLTTINEAAFPGVLGLSERFPARRRSRKTTVVYSLSVTFSNNTKLNNAQLLPVKIKMTFAITRLPHWQGIL